MTRYGELVRALMEDQFKRVADKSHRRRITERNSRESLRIALRARQLACHDLPSPQIELVKS